MLRNSVKQECLTRVPNQRVKPRCSTSASGRKWVLRSGTHIPVGIRVRGLHPFFLRKKFGGSRMGRLHLTMMIAFSFSVGSA